MFCVFTKVLWRKVIQLLLNKIMHYFHFFPVSKVDKS